MILIDSHCHLDAPEFDADRDAVIARARTVGVMAQIIPAVAANGWTKLRALCTEDSGLYPAIGLHPMFLSEHRDEHLDDFWEFFRDFRPIAIGECGLDFYIEGLDKQRQQFFFGQQLKIARTFDLPVIVHARKAVDAVISALHTAGRLQGVVHSFSGSQQQAEQLWNLDFCIGIGGPVTYERAARLRRIVATMPIEFLLLETDSPDQPGQGQRGQRNEPALLRDVLRVVAELRGVDEVEIAAATTRNAERVFRLPELA